MYRNWPVPLPQVDPEEPPADQPLSGGNTSMIQTLGDGTVWKTTGAGWQRLPQIDPHKIRHVHRVLPAMDAAIWVIEVAGGDDVALIEACADVAMMALKKLESSELRLAAAVLYSASRRARYDPRNLDQASPTE